MLTSYTKDERNILFVLFSPSASQRWGILCTDCFKLPYLCMAVKTKMCFSLASSFVLFFRIYFLLGLSPLVVNDAEEMHVLCFALMHSLALAFSLVFKDMQDLLTLNREVKRAHLCYSRGHRYLSQLQMNAESGLGGSIHHCTG